MLQDFRLKESRLASLEESQLASLEVSRLASLEESQQASLEESRLASLEVELQAGLELPVFCRVFSLQLGQDSVQDQPIPYDHQYQHISELTGSIALGMVCQTGSCC